MPDERADFVEPDRIDVVVGEPHGVGVAHANAGQRKAVVGNAQFVVQHRSGARCADRDLVRMQIRGTDRHAHLVDRGGRVAELCMQNAGARLDREPTIGGCDPGPLDEGIW